MNGITLKICSNKKILITSFLTLLLSTNVLSCIKYWNRTYFDVIHNIADNCIEMKFKVFDYHFGPCGENGYLSECNFYISNDDHRYMVLLTVITSDQAHIGNWTWFTMTNKLPSAKIQFGKCFTPGAGKIWAENTNQRVEVTNSPDGDRAWFNVIWHLEHKYQKVKYIYLLGVWHVNGIYHNNYINETFEINKFIISESKIPVSLDSLQNQVKRPVAYLPENNETRVRGVADAIVVKGAERGQNINVYTTSGALIKTIIATNDVEKIELSSNQIYIVDIAQNRYRVAL